MTENNNKATALYQKLEAYEAEIQNLKTRVDGLEKSRHDFTVAIAVAKVLGISAALVLAWIYLMAKEAQELKNKVLVTVQQVDSTAKIASKTANELRQEIDGMNVKETRKKLEDASKNHANMLSELKTVKSEYEQELKSSQFESNRYKAQMTKLANGVELQIMTTDRDTTPDYLAGEIIMLEAGRDTTLKGGMSASVKKYILTLDKSTKNIFPILSYKKANKVKFLTKE